MGEKPMLLQNAVQHYDWGDKSAIPQLLNRPPDGQPWAELWMGAHKKAPSQVLVSGELQTLDSVIANDPPRHLGARAQSLANARLPFLAKLLAASRSLSIQCHPDRAQAHAGFALESARGQQLTDPTRNYRDDHHKPELLIALEPFHALLGLRTASQIVENFERLGLIEPAEGLARLRADGDEALSAFVESLLTLRGQADDLIAQALSAIVPGNSDDVWVQRLAEEHPGDPGVLAPLFMSVVSLQPLEALFLGPGTLHAYLQGFAVEVMAASDNVLRAGLTTKHIDVAELLQVGSFKPEKPTILKPVERDDGHQTWLTPAHEFEVSRLLLRKRREIGPPSTSPPVSKRAVGLPGDGGPRIVFVTEGEVRVCTPAGSLPLERGQSCFLSASVERADLEGAGVAFCVSVPPLR